MLFDMEFLYIVSTYFIFHNRMGLKIARYLLLLVETRFGQVDISQAELGAGQMDQGSPTPNGTGGNQTIFTELKTR